MFTKKQLVIKNNLLNYYERTPKVCKWNMIFLHGWRSDATAWNKVINDLNFEDIGIYVLDLPGFGQSQIPHEAYNLSDYVETLNEFIQKLKLENIILVGHSFGGRIAIKFTAHHDAKLLILVDSAGIKNISIAKNLKMVLAKIIHPIFKLPGLQKLREKIYKKIGAEDYVATPYLRDTFVNLINEDLQSEMKLIRTPTVLIWGDCDTETPLKIGQVMNRLIADSNLYILEGAGHFSFIDKTTDFVEILKKTIDELSV